MKQRECGRDMVYTYEKKNTTIKKQKGSKMNSQYFVHTNLLEKKRRKIHQYINESR